MKNRFRHLIAALALLVPVAGFANTAPALEKAPIDIRDVESLQRGAHTFTNYCLSCHSASFMRFNRLQDLSLTEAQIKENLMFTTDKIGDTMNAAMSSKDAAQWFGAAPPDLSLETRLRGDDWVYTYLLSFYEDPSRPWGANNLVLANAAMPHVLHNMQEELSADEFESEVGDLVNFMAWMAEPVRHDRQVIGFFVILFLLVLLIPVYLLNKEFWKDVK